MSIAFFATGVLELEVVVQVVGAEVERARPAELVSSRRIEGALRAAAPRGGW